MEQLSISAFGTGALGLAVADALEAFARAPLEQAPAWRALAAAY